MGGKNPLSRYSGLEKGHCPGAGEGREGTVKIRLRKKQRWPATVWAGMFPLVWLGPDAHLGKLHDFTPSPGSEQALKSLPFPASTLMKCLPSKGTQ